MAEKDTAIRRADYEVPKFFTPEIHMAFYLDDGGVDGQTRIVTTTKVKRNGKHADPFILNGEYFQLDGVQINGQAISEGKDLASGYVKDDETLSLAVDDDEFELVVETSFNATENGAAEGLYKQGGSYTTQCEAEGFRRITYAVDRPDNLAKFTTDIIFKPAEIKNALSNGNMVEEKDLGDGLVRRRWEDPFLKPTYLFALCGNNFAMIEDTYVTSSGRSVALEVYAEPKYQDGLQHAMQSLKNSMKWDEDVWGLEYDLDNYMVVADDYFNMGAMENKGLNVFNPKYLLAHPKYADDADYYNVEGVIGHEYFHNWTGNRVTVKNWLELCLKEGLTVFRDQSFSADMSNALASRIGDVTALKNSQFPEDTGPMVHAPRMEMAEEMNNIYTSTVYNKGAEVVRILEGIVGKDGFRKGADLYFQRHDGQAVTVEDWVQAHADANQVDLDQYMLWYTQGGRPTLDASWSYDEDRSKFILDLAQSVPSIDGVSNGQSRVIPVAFGLLDATGKEIASEVLQLSTDKDRYEFDAPAGCVPSLLRNFSAPVSLVASYNNDDLLFLAENDTDMFNRWQATQTLLEREIVAGVKAEQDGQSAAFDPRIVGLFKATMQNPALDDEVKALMLSIPSVGLIEQQLTDRDPQLIRDVRAQLESAIAKDLAAEWLDVYKSTADYNKPYEYNMAEKGRRALANKALHYIASSEEASVYPLLQAQYTLSNNFNDKQAAFRAIMNSNFAAGDAQKYSDDFYNQGKDFVTATDRWAMLVAVSKNTTMADFDALCNHPDNKGNKTANRIRSMYNGLSGNIDLFHAADGSGYAALASKIIELESGAEDQRNPQLASRLVDNFAEFKHYKAELQQKMTEQIERIAAAPVMSKNTAEKLKSFLGAGVYEAIRTPAATQNKASGTGPTPTGSVGAG
jgi:aminopeptidase N